MAGPRVREASVRRSGRAVDPGASAGALALLGSRLTVIDLDSVEGPTVDTIGPTGVYRDLRPSPDGRHLLVTRIEVDRCALATLDSCPRRLELWDLGRRARIAANVGRDRSSTGREPRAVGWIESLPSSLAWVVRRPGGPNRSAADTVVRLDPPFDHAPVPIADIGGSFVGLWWIADRPAGLLLDRDPVSGRMRTSSIRADGAPAVSGWQPEGTLLLPLTEPSRTTRPVVTRRGERVLLQRFGAAGPDHDGGPALIELDLETLESSTLWLGDGDRHDVLLESIPGDASRILLRTETERSPPNYVVLDPGTGERTAITRFADPSPPLRDLRHRWLHYAREDGVPLSARIHLPPAPISEPPPLVLWIYPTRRGVTTPASGSAPVRFPRLDGLSPLVLALDGFAVMTDVSMPVVGPPTTANDTFLEQLVMNAEAAIETAAGLGLVDPQRVVVAGHSYGASSSVALIAQSDRFRAAVAISGGYNRTLTPFGFQTETRPFWEAPEAYLSMSPLLAAHRIETPLLLMHGAEDDHPGTAPAQSEALYEALVRQGREARMVLFPHEGHVFRARESILHAAAELLDWARKHAGSPRAGPTTVAGGSGLSSGTASP